MSPSAKLKPSVFLKELIDFTFSKIYRQKLEKVEKLLNEKNRLQVVIELGNSVEAFNSFPTTICSFLRNFNSFEKSVLYAICLGGDTDTIGAMTGAISGAYHGIEAIPEGWRKKLEKREYIEKLAEKLWCAKERERVRRR